MQYRNPTKCHQSCGTNRCGARSIEECRPGGGGIFLLTMSAHAMQIREIEITHQLGLHARACARIVALATRFRCNVALICGRRRASARSIVAVMLLAGGMGSLIRV